MNNSILALRYCDNSKKQVHQRRIFSTPALIVELEGVEPSSAQGNHTLSTRLFQPLIFEQQQDSEQHPLSDGSFSRLAGELS